MHYLFRTQGHYTGIYLYFLRRERESNPRITVLQTVTLPLGYRAVMSCAELGAYYHYPTFRSRIESLCKCYISLVVVVYAVCNSPPTHTPLRNCAAVLRFELIFLRSERNVLPLNDTAIFSRPIRS